LTSGSGRPPMWNLTKSLARDAVDSQRKEHCQVLSGEGQEEVVKTSTLFLDFVLCGTYIIITWATTSRVWIYVRQQSENIDAKKLKINKLIFFKKK
jgi:hypothetical protein